VSRTWYAPNRGHICISNFFINLPVDHDRLTFKLDWCALLAVGWATFVPVLVFMGLFVLDSWQMHHMTSQPLTLVVMALVDGTGLRAMCV